MPAKPATQVIVLDVLTVTIGADPAEGAIIRLSLEGSTDAELVFDALTLAKLQSILSEADAVQADRQPSH